MLTVGNIYNPATHLDKAHSIYIGRASSWHCARNLADTNYCCLGNPFPMATEAERVKVCQEFYVYIIDKYHRDAMIHQAIEKLLELHASKEKYVLLCFCFPRRCHGNELIKFIEFLQVSKK